MPSLTPNISWMTTIAPLGVPSGSASHALKLPSPSKVAISIMAIGRPPLAQAASIDIDATSQKLGEERKPMKVTVDVDCTPEEARRFLGLPDLSPVHDAYVAKM